MKKNVLTAGLAALTLLTAPQALAQTGNQFSVNIDHLSRGEFRMGGFSGGETDGGEAEGGNAAGEAAFVLGRTRLGFEYEREGLSARMGVQQGGTWGSQGFGALQISEAWAKWKGGNGLFIQVGRQNLIYDDQRIFGNDDWAMTAISHDVLRTGLERRGYKAHLILAYNQNPENMSGGSFYSGGVQPYKVMEAFWYHWDVPGIPLGASLLLTNITMQGGESQLDASEHNQQLFGTYLSFRPKTWAAEAAAYWQRGENESGIPINAWMGSLKASVKLSDTFTLRTGYDYLSGDENFATPTGGMIGMTRHDTIRGFNSLYGSRHSFYGAMDFFYVSTYFNGFTPGLQNLYTGVKWAPVKEFDLDASYHFLATAAKLQNADKPLGHEVELSAGYALGKDIRLSAGYSFMYGTQTMEVLKRSSDRHRLHWAWLMLTVSPSVFTSKW